jgi:thymidylate synthase ThyX
MAHRVRFVMQMSAREAMHLTELRSQAQGHPTYRRVAQAMHRAIAAVHPTLGSAFTYLSYETSTWSASRRSVARTRSVAPSARPDGYQPLLHSAVVSTLAYVAP